VASLATLAYPHLTHVIDELARLRQWRNGVVGGEGMQAHLIGRHLERAKIDQLIAQANKGQSGALVLRGEVGIGKTALMEHARATATAQGFQVGSAAGTEAESQFAFAGLHQLCEPLLEGADRLPEPQQAALGVAFGTQVGSAPDRFLVGLAALNLLANTAEKAPLLCVIDDAHWLDVASAQVLAFVARRMSAERAAVLFARRLGVGDEQSFMGLPELPLEGLGEEDSRTLLASVVHSPLDAVVRDQIIAEARGNPLALLEFPHSAGATQLAGGFGLPAGTSLPRRIEESFRQRCSTLPTATRELLLIAAADPTGDPTLLWRAAMHRRITPEAASPAEVAGLVEIDTRVRFRHPLVRSAIYEDATPAARRLAHEALATATDEQIDPDRHAWHRARAVLGTSEDVAAELERSAGRARARGGLAAAAAFLQQAVALTPDPATRATRALEAAHANHEAGAYEAAMDLALAASAGPLDPLQQARVALLRAGIAFHLTRGGDVPEMLLDAAKTLTPLDAALARETYLYALDAAVHAGHLAGSINLRAVAHTALQAPALSGAATPADLLLDGLRTRSLDGFEHSVPALKRALALLLTHSPRTDGREDRRWLRLALNVAAMLWDDETLYVLADRAMQSARESGALSTLPAALNAVASLRVLSGELPQANELALQEAAIAEATGVPPLTHARLMIAAWSGQESETLRLHAVMVEEATRRGEGATIDLANVTLASLHNGLGNFGDAFVAASSPVDHDAFTYSSLALPELVEAAAQIGERRRALAAMEQLESRARASGTPLALGLAARSRALMSADSDADQHYRDAIAQLTKCRYAVYLARTHLIYGEWLVRMGRRKEARNQLRVAHQLLLEMGLQAYAGRAARGLSAVGARPVNATARPTDSLTAHELHIARLVATGATTNEVALQMVLSPRTIETHLRNIFRKLGITSRRQLKDLPLP